jgi:hypothetical protein
MLRIGDTEDSCDFRSRGAHTRPVDYGKIGNIIYKYGQQSSSFDPHKQKILEIIRRLVPTDLKLVYVAAHLSEWTSDVTNNYEDLEELYKEMLDGRVCT